MGATRGVQENHARPRRCGMTGQRGHLTGSLGAEFLAAFNDIERHFRDTLHCDERVSFKTMIGAYEQQYHLSTEQARALQAWARLRNAISHSSYFDGRPIAEPAAQVVDEIRELRDLILSPPLLWDCLERRASPSPILAHPFARCSTWSVSTTTPRCPYTETSDTSGCLPPTASPDGSRTG
jgi:hypothetical protein